MAKHSMKDLLIEELRDIYHGETQITKALPKMARKATSPELRQAFESHLEETHRQVERLEEIFDELDARKRGKRCEAVEGLVEEAKEIMDLDLEPHVMDAGLIGAAQKVEHYEIAAYGTLRAWARDLGMTRIAELLEQTLSEEHEADRKLNQIATQRVNPEAERRASGA